MSIQTFTAAQVLTAAQMNTLQANDYNQTVSNKTGSYTLVAADKGTRIVMNVASSNTVTVNTSLFSAGDTLVIQNIGAGVTTVTAGTATVSSAGPLTISQYGSGTLYFTSAGVSLWFPSAGPAVSSGLTFISSTNLSGSSTTISNCFSATYECYFVTMSNMLVNSGSVSLQMRLGSGTNHTYNNQVINAPKFFTKELCVRSCFSFRIVYRIRTRRVGCLGCIENKRCHALNLQSVSTCGNNCIDNSSSILEWWNGYRSIWYI
jgi:hypothetical protein